MVKAEQIPDGGINIHERLGLASVPAHNLGDLTSGWRETRMNFKHMVFQGEEDYEHSRDKWLQECLFTKQTKNKSSVLLHQCLPPVPMQIGVKAAHPAGIPGTERCVSVSRQVVRALRYSVAG